MSKPKRTYPYQLPAIPSLSKADFERIDPQSAREFLRIEALLRSQEVHRLYRKKQVGITWERYGIFVRSALEGQHHLFLRPGTSVAPRVDTPNGEGILGHGVVDVAASLRGKNESDLKGPLDFWTGRLLKDSPRFLYVRLDTAYPPITIWNALRPLLTTRHKEKHPARYRTQGEKFLAKPKGTRAWRSSVWPAFDLRPNRKTLDLQTWIHRLRCYDLRIQQGLTYGQIAKTVYPDASSATRAYTKAKLSVRRTEQIIRAAQQGRWPPRIT